MNLSAELDWFRDRARLWLDRDRRWRRFLQIWFVIFGSALGAGAEAVAAAVAEPIRLALHVVAIIGVLAAFIGGLVFTVVDEGAPEAISRAVAAIAEAEETQNVIDGLEASFLWITRLYTVSRALNAVAERVMAEGVTTAEARQQNFAILLDLVVAHKTVLFGIGDEQWNFAIYLYDPRRDQLDCTICRRPSRAEEEAPHRSWKPNEGHIGKAYAAARAYADDKANAASVPLEYVAPDTREPAVAPYFMAPAAKTRPGDQTQYRSIASLPIWLVGGAPFGVLVATSDRPGRFQRLDSTSPGVENHVEPLRILATTLAFILHRAQLG